MYVQITNTVSDCIYIHECNLTLYNITESVALTLGYYTADYGILPTNIQYQLHTYIANSGAVIDNVNPL